VTVIELHASKVKLLVEAPRETAVHREEVWLAINEEFAKKARG
jgi:carbon storage regulator CsrA